MNLEFSSMCRRKKHSPFHCNTLMKQSLLTLIWTSCKRNVLMTIGTSIRAETCQIRGKVFTKFTLLTEKSPKGYLWAGRRLTKVQTTTGPDHVCPEVMTKIGKAAQNREKQEWKLDNARRQRGIYFFWTWWPSSQRNSQTCEEKIGKTFGSSHAVQKARTSTTKVAAKEEIASKNIHQNDLRLYCGIPWVHQATSGIFATHNIWRSHCRQRFHFDDPLQFGMPPQKRGVRTQFTNFQRQSRAPWWHCKRRLWSLPSFLAECPFLVRDQ